MVGGQTLNDQAFIVVRPALNLYHFQMSGFKNTGQELRDGVDARD